MESAHQPDARDPAPGEAARRVGVLSAAVTAPALSALVLITAAGTDAHLGASRYWPWVPTGLQVLGLWSAGSGQRWGWLLGAAVQLPWIAYALVTGQLGFIPGCAISAVVQAHSFATDQSPARRQRARDGVQVYV
ncbi:MAG: hypothetical protein GEU78_05615 [Actinobacteria bacterium]|nr:hypothetical protein [Actinomycetota bacterium]